VDVVPVCMPMTRTMSSIFVVFRRRVIEEFWVLMLR